MILFNLSLELLPTALVILSKNDPQLRHLMDVGVTSWRIWATIISHSVQLIPVNKIALHYSAPLRLRKPEQRVPACPALTQLATSVPQCQLLAKLNYLKRDGVCFMIKFFEFYHNSGLYWTVIRQVTRSDT